MWWIIIGAVVALVVMIVLMVMFGSKSNTLEAGTTACESKGGVCANFGGSCPKNTLPATAFECSNQEICCIGAPKDCTGDLGSCGAGSNCNFQTKSRPGKLFCT